MPLAQATQEISWSLLNISEKLNNIEAGLTRLTYRTGRPCIRREVADLPDPGTLKWVQYIDPTTGQPVAEYEVRDDPPRIMIRMRDEK